MKRFRTLFSVDVSLETRSRLYRTELAFSFSNLYSRTQSKDSIVGLVSIASPSSVFLLTRYLSPARYTERFDFHWYLKSVNLPIYHLYSLLSMAQYLPFYRDMLRCMFAVNNFFRQAGPSTLSTFAVKIYPSFSSSKLRRALESHLYRLCLDEPLRRAYVLDRTRFVYVPPLLGAYRSSMCSCEHVCTYGTFML